MDHELRIGKFTSSQAHRLVGFGRNKKDPSVAFDTYVKDVYIETIMQRPITPETNAKALRWGSLMEHVMFDVIGFDFGYYEMTHNETIQSKICSVHSGTPDMIKQNCIGEIKSYYLKNFYDLTTVLQQRNIELLKKEFTKEYWQCVSNALLCDTEYAELFVFMPKKKVLLGIFESIRDTDYLQQKGLNPSDYLFYTDDNIESFEYIPDDVLFPTITSFEFKVTQEDKDLLLMRLGMAENKLDKMLSQS